MKKQAVLKSFLILLPVLAVGLATAGDSVIVFDPATGETSYYAYFDLAPVAELQMLPPLAAMLSAVSGMLAAIWLVKKKEWCLKGMVGVSFVSACAAGFPVIQQGAVRMVPNVGLPIFMFVHCLLAYHYLKNPEKTGEKKENPKIKR